jgi:protein-tyrosine phosphatase
MSLRLLFVCLGNICRSPTAEVIVRERLDGLGLDPVVELDSAGTGSWHIGKAPDARTRSAGAQRGYNMDGLRARQVVPEDFQHFDYVLAMDQANLADLAMMRPRDARAELRLFLDFHPQHQQRDVPDPYYGGEQGFADVLDLVEEGAEGLIQHLRHRHGL